MVYVKINNSIIRYAVMAIAFVLLTACAKSGNQFETDTRISRVVGRISSIAGAPGVMNISYMGDADRHTSVLLAQVQEDGLLKTVSAQNVQTDKEGNFVVETDLNNVENLILVATQNSTELKAIVSAKAEWGNTVYAPPLNAGTTKEADLYIKLTGQKQDAGIDVADLDILVNEEGTLYIGDNPENEAKFIKMLKAYSQTFTLAMNSPYFGLSKNQIQIIQTAKKDAKIKLDAALYNSFNTGKGIEKTIDKYEKQILLTCSGNNIDPAIYTELMRIGVTSYLKSAGMIISLDRIPLVRSIYERYIIVLNSAVEHQFRKMGASDAQIKAIRLAGTALNDSIKISIDDNQITDAFTQYNSAVKKQLMEALSNYAQIVEMTDEAINEVKSAKEVLLSSLKETITPETAINAYITFFNISELLTRTKLIGASYEFVTDVSRIITLLNMN